MLEKPFVQEMLLAITIKVAVDEASHNMFYSTHVRMLGTTMHLMKIILQY